MQVRRSLKPPHCGLIRVPTVTTMGQNARFMSVIVLFGSSWKVWSNPRPLPQVPYFGLREGYPSSQILRQEVPEFQV